MKLMKNILIVAGLIVGVVLVVALFLPEKIRIQRSIVIDRPVDKVYEQVADFNHWHKWNPWTGMEPSAKNIIAGKGGEAGSSWNWEGREGGKGSMVLNEREPRKWLKSTLRFRKPVEGEAQSNWAFEDIGKKTRVTWTYTNQADYPHGRYMAVLLEKMLGKQFEKGLKNLKKVCESEEE